MTEIPRAFFHEPVSIFANKERQLKEEIERTTTDFTSVVNSLTAIHGIEAGQHAVSFLSGYVSLLSHLSSLPGDINIRDIMSGIAANMEHEVEDTLTVYTEE